MEVRDLDVLEEAFDVVERLMRGVRGDQLGAPTPCPDFDVRQLQDHVVGWLQMFEAWANGRRWEGDAEAYAATDPPTELRPLADSALDGWRTHGTDREIQGTSGALPGDFVLSMMITEYVVHGWDLAVATSQPVEGYSEEQLERAYERGRGMLGRPEYRGPGKAFGEEVAVPADAPPLDRLVGWFGRDPSWSRA